MPSFYFDKKRNNAGKGALYPLGWSEIRKTKIHSTRILSEPVYTQPVFHPNLYTPDPYLIRPPELTGLPRTLND